MVRIFLKNLNFNKYLSLYLYSENWNGFCVQRNMGSILLENP